MTPSKQGEHIGEARRPLRQLSPAWVQRQGRALAVKTGEATAGMRMAPTFLVVGVQRCGTTSLFRALAAHPEIVRPVFHKGINYFDLSYERGWSWYQGHFPLRRSWLSRTQPSRVAFEASGYYLYHPLAIPRIARDLPDVRLLVMLRDPVERAFSAYKHERARGDERESFEVAIEREDERLSGEAERMVREPGYASYEYRHHGYLNRGRYADQLEKAMAHIPRERIHIVDSGQFFAEPAGAYRQITRFLGLKDFVPTAFDQYNARPGAMDPAIRERLREHFAPHDARLAQLNGRRLSWMDDG